MSDLPYDDFEIIREIGRGGTAIVYEAYQKSLRRKVALKQLPAAAVMDHRWLDRFRDEIRATAQLNHPNIVPFYEFGRIDDSHFYTMQLIDGVSLAEVVRWLRQCRESADCSSRPCRNEAKDAVHPAVLKLCERGKCRSVQGEDSEWTDPVTSPFYHRAAIELMRDVALAVDHAHNQGILHLDVKPSNILIDIHGKTWITDFGAARSCHGVTGSQGQSGTLCYMSPEQALGRDEQLDVRSDVYSLGATLYELLALERPFGHSSPHALLTQVSVGQFAASREVNEAISPELDSIITKAMASSPDQRHATAHDFSDELESYLSAPPADLTAREDHRTGRFHGRILAAFLAIGALVITLAITPSKESFPGPVYGWNGHFYALTENEVDWVAAEAEAVKHGGHLVTINDHDEQQFIVDTFLTPPGRVFWIGLTDAEKEGDWHWVSGEPVEYTNWESRGEPNNVKWTDPETGQKVGENYGVINWHLVYEPGRRRAGTWNDFRTIFDNDRVEGFHGIMEFEADPR